MIRRLLVIHQNNEQQQRGGGGESLHDASPDQDLHRIEPEKVHQDPEEGEARDAA